MAEGVNVRFSGELQRFIQERTGDSGIYASASEYIRDLVRHAYEREEERKHLQHVKIHPQVHCPCPSFSSRIGSRCFGVRSTPCRTRSQKLTSVRRPVGVPGVTELRWSSRHPGTP